MVLRLLLNTQPIPLNSYKPLRNNSDSKLLSHELDNTIPNHLRNINTLERECRSSQAFLVANEAVFHLLLHFQLLSLNFLGKILLTKIDWKETPEAHVFKADLPGLKKEEVKVEIEDDRVLQISGERNVEKEEKNDKWHRVERSSGKFLRKFRLPENAKMDQVKACIENGVLTVTVPKVEVKKPDVKTIEISG